MFLRRLVSSCAAALVSLALLSGCSSSHGIGMTDMPTAQSTSQSADGRQTTSLIAAPISYIAWPIEIVGFPISVLGWPISQEATAVCPPRPKGTASCRAQYRNDITPNPDPNPASIPGYHPSDLQSAYGLTAASSSAGGNQTVAAIVAYAPPAPGLARDLNIYRADPAPVTTSMVPAA
jgi:hypothetical protein